MTELELLTVIGYAQDVHILDAEEMPSKKAVLPFPKAMIRTIAAILAVAIAAGLFLQTPMGAAAVEVVREQIERFLDVLFPPKELVVYLEGEPETIPHEAQGREPESETPGFAIYVDTSSYTMTQEGESWFIRPNSIPVSREDIREQQKALLEGLSPEEQERAIDQRIAELEEFYDSLPPVEMEIREWPDLAPIPAAKQMHTQMDGTWETLTEMWSVWLEGQKEGMTFTAKQGSSSDSRIEVHYFLDNSRGGCFHIISRYYPEAAEGHGTRFHAMVQTFSIVAPQDPSQYDSQADALKGSMEQETVYAKERNNALLEQQKNSVTQNGKTSCAVERSGLWHDAHSKLWTALEQTLDDDTLANLTWEHFQWATQRRITLDSKQEELGHTPETTMTVYGLDADLVQERAAVLLTYLQGSAVPAQRPEGVAFSPDALVAELADAYFSGDSDTIRAHLSSSYTGTAFTYPFDPDLIVRHTTKGLHDICRTMTKQGYLPASIEFREAPDSDSYTYLSIHLVWENNRWAVSEYGLER